MNSHSQEIDLTQDYANCPLCHQSCQNYTKVRRYPKKMGGGTHTVIVSRHYCHDCNKFFTPTNDEFPKGKHYTREVIDTVVAMRKKGMKLEDIACLMLNRYKVKISLAAISNWEKRYA